MYSLEVLLINTVFLTLTSYPTYVVDYHTAYISPTLPQQMYANDSAGYPAPSSHPTTYLSRAPQASTFSTILPKVIYPAPMSVLSGKQTFQVYGQSGVHVDFQLQPVGIN